MPNPSGLPTVPPGYVDEDTGQTIAPVPVATWSDADRSAAIEAANAAMVAFARPGLNQDTWWKELSPLLTPQARTDYAYVQASVVPASRVTGSGTITDDTSAMVVHVDVPTDVIQMLPFAAVMAVLIAFGRKADLPSALGAAYVRGAR